MTKGAKSLTFPEERNMNMQTAASTVEGALHFVGV